MRFARLSWVVLVVLGVHGPASAGLGIFSRKPKVDPAEHVPTLIMQLKTDKDEAKRTTAAEELRNFDPRAYPEMMTVLMDALIKDASPGVRSEAATTIARLRPVNQQAGFALEQAAANDPQLRVRMSARQALWQYNLLGYRSSKAPTPDTKAAQGPPVAPPPGKPHLSLKFTRGMQESPEPPLADPPSGSSTHPVAAPKLLTPPSNKAASKSGKPGPQEGPSLNPPA